MNKKGGIILTILVVLLILSVFGISVWSIQERLEKLSEEKEQEFKELAEHRCERLDLELLDYERGTLLKDEIITCVNNETKQITKIR